MEGEKQRQKIKHLSPCLLSLGQLHSLTPSSSTECPPAQVEQGDKEWWLWSVHNCFSLLFLPHTSTLPQYGPLPDRVVLQDTSTPVCVPYRPQLLARTSSGVGSPLPTVPEENIHLLSYGTLHGISVGMCSGMVFHACSGAWSTSSSPFFFDVGV